MSILSSQILTSSPEFKSNEAFHLEEVKKLETELARIREGGGKELKEKHESRGKLFVRDRIAKLIDPGTPFMELGAFAAFGMYDNAAPGAGVVTGIGLVHGKRWHLFSDDGKEAHSRSRDRERK
jgi:acetyl-CoA carboxylase carboxyltransferase component